MTEKDFMKTGDLVPAWAVLIGDTDETADLTGVTSWRFVARQQGAVLFTDTSPTVVVGTDPWTAIVTHDWVAGETDVPGRLMAEIVAVWPGGEEQTFPSKGHATLTLERSID